MYFAERECGMEGGISKKILAVWEASAVLAAAVLAGAALWLLPARTWYWYLILWLIGLALVFCSFLWLPLLCESCRYTITPEYIEYSRGVFFFVRTRVLRRSIMYVTIVRSPISPLLRTRSLVVSSMGGSLMLPSLPIREAEALLQEITPKRPAIRSRIFASGRGKRHD